MTDASMAETARRTVIFENLEVGGDTPDDASARRRLTIERIALAVASMRSPLTEVRGTMKGPTICGPDRIQAVIHEPATMGEALRIGIHHEGFETIDLVAAGDHQSLMPHPEDEEYVHAVADAVEAFGVLLASLDHADDHGRDDAVLIVRTAASVLRTVSDAVLSSQVRIVCRSPFLSEDVVCLDGGEQEHRVVTEAKAWRHRLPPIVDVSASYGERHCRIRVSQRTIWGETLDTMGMLRAKALLAGLGGAA